MNLGPSPDYLYGASTIAFGRRVAARKSLAPSEVNVNPYNDPYVNAALYNSLGPPELQGNDGSMSTIRTYPQRTSFFQARG